MDKIEFREKCNVMYHAMLQKVPQHHQLVLIDQSDYRMSMALRSALNFREQIYHIWLVDGVAIWGVE